MEKAVLHTDGGVGARESHQRWIRAGRPAGPQTVAKRPAKDYDAGLITRMKKRLELICKGSAQVTSKKYNPALVASMRKSLDRVTKGSAWTSSKRF